MVPNMLQHGAQEVRKWCSTCHEMLPDKSENGAQRCFNTFNCGLFMPVFSQFEFYLCLSLSDSSPTKITNDNCKNFTLPTLKKQ